MTPEQIATLKERLHSMEKVQSDNGMAGRIGRCKRDESLGNTRKD